MGAFFFVGALILLATRRAIGSSGRRTLKFAAILGPVILIGFIASGWADSRLSGMTP